MSTEWLKQLNLSEPINHDEETDGTRWLIENDPRGARKRTKDIFAIGERQPLTNLDAHFGFSSDSAPHQQFERGEFFDDREALLLQMDKDGDW
ncbi:hypothetical protein JW758_00990 [Candidatus Peregrinibacteria bacterium]|nr:hypothetical protein [Candidatus Peregrinibacteria bacterium]